MAHGIGVDLGLLSVWETKQRDDRNNERLRYRLFLFLRVFVFLRVWNGASYNSRRSLQISSKRTSQPERPASLSKRLNNAFSGRGQHAHDDLRCDSVAL